MDFQYFEEGFRKNITLLWDEGIISDKKGMTNEEDLDCLMPSSWTFLFNIAVYDIVKAYNKDIKDELRLIPEDNSGKKGGFSDLSIISEDGKIKFIEIEHENNPNNLIKGYEKLISKNKAIIKLLIGYENKKMKKGDIVTQLKQLKEKKAELGQVPVIKLMIAPECIKDGGKYEVIEI